MAGTWENSGDVFPTLRKTMSNGNCIFHFTCIDYTLSCGKGNLTQVGKAEDVLMLGADLLLSVHRDRHQDENI